MDFSRIRLGLVVALAGLALFAGCGKAAPTATSEEICNPKIASGTPKSIRVQEQYEPVRQFDHDHPEWVGGMWLDNVKAHLVIVLVPGTNRAALDAALAQSRIAPSNVEFRHAKRSEAELQKESRDFFETQLPKLKKEGYQVVSAGLRPESNLNCVGVVELTDAGRQTLEARYPTIRFFAQGPFSY